MGKSTISMAIFNSYGSLPEDKFYQAFCNVLYLAAWFLAKQNRFQQD